MGGQAPDPEQDTSQLHDMAQSTVWHAPEPAHRTVHSFEPQLTLPHAVALAQATSQLRAWAQSTSPHAPPLVHRTVQSRPGGHCTLPHGLPALHSIRQLWASSHDVHGLGQLLPLLPLSMQNPWSQNRPGAHWLALPDGSHV